MSGAWLGVLLSVSLIAAGVLPLPGEGAFRGFVIPVWGLIIEIIVGLILGFYSVRALLRGEGKPRPYTDEDVEKSKRILEQMHMRDHGAPPEYPGEDGRKQ